MTRCNLSFDRDEAELCPWRVIVQMSLNRVRVVAMLLSWAVAPVLCGCAALPRGEAVPVALTTKAEVPGLPGVRFWADDPEPTAFAAVAVKSVEREMARLGVPAEGGKLPPAEFLAVSGGGANGAFGAGLLCGWTEHGTRPTFKGVTGISTGALIAPFAFLGPKHDDTLRKFYTTISTKDILKPRGLMGALSSDALADNGPLQEMVAGLMTKELLREIADEYAKGRLLLVGTTNLDALRPVIWDIGAIASSDHPEAPDLVRKILVASAAIPAAFPPMFIGVEFDGKKYQEMHVDGGAMTQVFLYPPSLHARELAAARKVNRERRLYVIRNARLDPDWAQVERKTLPIAGRAITSLIQTQGMGDLYRIFLTAQRDGLDFHLAYMPADFNVQPKEDFDPEYMGALFERARKMAAEGYPWSKQPPGLGGDELHTAAGEATRVGLTRIGE